MHTPFDFISMLILLNQEALDSHADHECLCMEHLCDKGSVRLACVLGFYFFIFLFLSLEK